MPEHERGPDVVGSGEIQKLLGVGRERVRQLAQRPDFPAYTELEIGRVWDRKSVVAWQRDRTSHGRNRRRQVLAAYRRTGRVADAARAADVSRRTARRWLEELDALAER